MDATVQPKPIYISPNEIYSLHTMLLRHQNQLVRIWSLLLLPICLTTNSKAGPDDILRVILSELGGVPHLNNEEFKDVRDTAITLELTNRFADVRGMSLQSLLVTRDLNPGQILRLKRRHAGSRPSAVSSPSCGSNQLKIFWSP